MTEETFTRKEAFSRNLGLISESEQETLHSSLAVIAGCGGVGGMHAHTLARLGVGRYRLTDFDSFGVGNFNRQMGASMNTVGHDKAEVTRDMILAINPEAEVELMPRGVQPNNADEFVAGAQVVIDGIDFFALSARRLLFTAAWKAGIPALTAAPLGFSGTIHAFVPDHMSFDDYFQISDQQPAFDNLVNFLLGLAPDALHAPYMDLSKLDPATGRGPSSVIGSQMAASLVGVETLRILLDRGDVLAAPYYRQVDLYRREFVTERLEGGNSNPEQQKKRAQLVELLRELGVEKAYADLDGG